MYAKDEVTVERARARVAALEHEKTGYAARIEAKKAGRSSGIGEDLSVKALEDRQKQVDAEIKLAKADITRAKKSRDKDEDGDTDTETEEPVAEEEQP